MERDELDRLYVLVELLTKRVETLEGYQRWPSAAFGPTLAPLGGQGSFNRGDPPCYEWLPIQGVSHERS